MDGFQKLFLVFEDLLQLHLLFSKMHSFNCVQQRLKLPINSYNRNASDLQLLNSCNYKEKIA